MGLIRVENIVEVAVHAYNEWNLAMAAAEGKEIQKTYKMQELCKAVKAVAEAAPLVDAVEVIRCKDCGGLKKLISAEGKVAYCCTRGWGLKGLVRLTDFCPNGEKRAGSVPEETEAHWVYWDGWRGNYNGRIDDAVCSHCGYKHKTVCQTETEKFSPNLLHNFCPECGRKMVKYVDRND